MSKIEETTVTIKSVNTEQKHSTKTGLDYETLEVVGEDGRVFTGFVNKDTVMPVIGSTVTVLYTIFHTRDGGTKLNIKDMKSTNSQGTVSTKTTVQSEHKSTTGNKVNTDGYEKSQERNRNGQRLGMCVNKAVDIAIRNSQVENETVRLTQIKSLAEELLKLTEELEG